MKPMLILGMFLFAADAAACQICASTMAYDTFRFTPVFFFIALAWIPIAIASELQSTRDRLGSPSLLRPLAKYLAVAALLWLIFGLHVFVIALFPLLLWKWTLSRPRRDSFPPWVRRAAVISLGAMAVSIPLSYALFPLTANEPTVRKRVSETKQLLRGVEERMRAGEADGWPEALSGDGTADPFDYRLVNIPLFAPVTLWDRYLQPHSHGPGPLAYVTSGTAALVWSRGPNTRFDLSPSQAAVHLNGDQDEIIGKLAPLHYDPTNGTISDGDIFRVVSQRSK